MTAQDHAGLRAVDMFQEVSCAAPTARRKKPAAPFSLRLSAEERAFLEDRAGGRPLGTYIRGRLLGGRGVKRRAVRKPRVDHRQLSLVLAELGRSRLSSNLNQLAKAVHTGTLPLPHEVERDLREACKAVLAMRDALIDALGLKVEGGAR